MLKKIAYSLLFAGSLVSSLSAATQAHFAPGLTLEYELSPIKPKVVTNISFWSVNARCTIHSQDKNSNILIKALKRKGTINKNILLDNGDSTLISVYNGEVIEIQAAPGAQVELINQGEHTIKASCSTVSL